MDLGGRPYSIAVLPEEPDTYEIRVQFLKVINSLSYREEMGLARALYISTSSIRTNWKNGRHFPGVDTAKRVIEWDNGGRKLETRKVSASLIDL